MKKTDEITLRSYAKINLSLEIIGRRPDGYHNIRSLMQGIGLYDVIRISKCPQNGTKYNLPHCTIESVVVYLCTDAKTIPMDMSNLAFKGISAVLTEAGLRSMDTHEPFDLIIDIDKQLPVAAGIAGGSGNAAVCMLGLNHLLGDPFSLRELMDIGVRVGADVPFSLMMNAGRNCSVLEGLRGLDEAGAAAWVSGIGEIVDPTAPVQRHIIMANPGISVSTKAAYEAIDAIQEAEGYKADGSSLTGPLFVNDLEAYTLRDYPEAAGLKTAMKNELCADTVLMSGSGPTMIAYYESAAEAAADFEKMRELADREPGWRTWLTYTGE